MKMINADTLLGILYDEKARSETRGIWYTTLTYMIRLIEAMPTHDAVCVCRCKDCQKWDDRFGLFDGQGKCDRTQLIMDEADYCSRPKRKSDD